MYDGRQMILDALGDFIGYSIYSVLLISYYYVLAKIVIACYKTIVQIPKNFIKAIRGD